MRSTKGRRPNVLIWSDGFGRPSFGVLFHGDEHFGERLRQQEVDVLNQ